MAGTRGTPLTARVGVVGERIEHWRRTRRKHGAMPEELWAAAVALARQYGTWPIARALRVDYATLKQRAARGEAEHVRGAARRGGFVEVDARALIGPANAAATTVVELCDSDGAKLTLRLGGGQQLDVRAVAEAFWRRGR